MKQATLVQNPGAIDHTPSSAVTAGDVVVTGARVEIARTDIAADRQGSLSCEGIYDIVKVTGAIAVGVDVFWDADGDPVGGTAGSGAATTEPLGPWIGRTTKAAGSSDTVVRTAFAQSPPEPLASEIADPGDGEAIPVDRSGHVNIVTAGAETRTLAAPSYAAQMLTLNFKTDGGDCVITCGTTVNQAGNNTLTAADAGDQIVLHAGVSGANLRWRVLANDGVALSTV
tara:strand:- start:10357 stop:11040 length:684 start_codon:yes stop_codon:yes gene_type:complete